LLAVWRVSGDRMTVLLNLARITLEEVLDDLRTGRKPSPKDIRAYRKIYLEIRNAVRSELNAEQIDCNVCGWTRRGGKECQFYMPDDRKHVLFRLCYQIIWNKLPDGAEVADLLAYLKKEHLSASTKAS
jgi:hypothetical protein